MHMNGVHHISLKAKGAEQFQQVLDFYQQVLDCPLVRRWGEGDHQGAMLDLRRVSSIVSAVINALNLLGISPTSRFE